MRWICYAVCIGLVAVQLSYSMPAAKESLTEDKENLRNVNTELQYPSVDLSNRQKRTVGVFRRIFPELSKTQGGEELNVLSEAASESKEVRVPFVPLQNDLDTAASGEDKSEASQEEELGDDIDISETDENSRSKRLGVFGNLFGGASADAGGDNSGSGNFLFDIIRSAADRTARAAGTVYRWVAGTNDIGLQGYSDGSQGPSLSVTFAAQTPVTASVPSPPTTASSGPENTTLVAGSGASEQQDEEGNAPSDEAQPHSVDDGYQTGIPGPITRLFVIANRGVANLVQDLILRLAQTSERFVNFKARLITAII